MQLYFLANILGVERILDMIRRSMNVTGDLTVISVIARSEGEELAPSRGRARG